MSSVWIRAAFKYFCVFNRLNDDIVKFQIIQNPFFYSIQSRNTKLMTKTYLVECFVIVSGNTIACVKVKKETHVRSMTANHLSCQIDWGFPMRNCFPLFFGTNFRSFYRAIHRFVNEASFTVYYNLFLFIYFSRNNDFN